MYKMTALWHMDPQHSALKEAGPVAVADTLIQTAYSLISTGTERLVACGNVPESLQASMAVPYMEGSLALPVKYGYSLVGRVIESSIHAPGSWVHLMHPHQNVCSIRGKDATPIPASVPPKRALLASNMETVINALWDAGLPQNSPVLIAGYGSIGALLARFCSRHWGASVSVLENQPEKRELIMKHGYALAENGAGPYACAFHCAANEQSLQYCIDHIDAESAVMELSWYGTRKVSLALGASFHLGRKKIISSQVSVIPPHKRQEWDFAKRKEYAFQLLTDDFYDGLLTHEIPFSAGAEFFNTNRNNPLPGIGYFFSYQTPTDVQR